MLSARHRILCLLLVFMTSMGPVAMGQDLIDRRQQRGNQRAEAGGVSLDEAVRMVEQRYNARAIKADTSRSGERRVHEIRLLKNGKVWTVRVDAATGQMF